MDPSAIDPAFAPFVSLLNPAMAALVPAVILLTQMLLAWTPLERIRDFGFLVAIGLGEVSAIAWSVLAGGPVTWDTAVSGVVVGVLAAITWKAGHEALKAAGGQTSGIVDRRLLLVMVVLATLLLMGLTATGCGTPSFTRYALSEAQGEMLQARTALDECRRDLAIDRDREALLQWQAYVADQADTVAKATAENRTPAELKKGLDALAEKFKTQHLAPIERNRERTDTRFRRAEQHLAYMSLIFARLDALARSEESVQQQLAEYKLMAEQVARDKFGLPPPAAASAEAALAQPLATAPAEPAAATSAAPAGP